MTESEGLDHQEVEVQVLPQRVLDFDLEVSVQVGFPPGADVDLAESVIEFMRFRGTLTSALQMMQGGVADLLAAGRVDDERLSVSLSVWATGGSLAVEAALESIDDRLVELGFPTVSLYAVESSNIAAMGWADPHDQELPPVAVVEFVGGSLYAYEGVPEEVFREWWEADSRGVYLNTHIKGVYEFRKLV